MIGDIHDDWFGNIFDVFLTKNTCVDDDLYTWENFDEAKRNLEEKENPSSKCFHLKEGLKIGFEHEMVLSDCYPDNIPEPRWVTLYNEWTKQKNAYKRRFMSDEDKENYSKFIVKWQEKCHIFSVAYELPQNLQSFQKILTKYIETKKAVSTNHCLFLTKTNKDSI